MKLRGWFFSIWLLAIVLKGIAFLCLKIILSVSRYGYFHAKDDAYSRFLYWWTIFIDLSIWRGKFTNYNEFTPSWISYFMNDYFSRWRIELEKRWKSYTNNMNVRVLSINEFVSSSSALQLISDHAELRLWRDRLDYIFHGQLRK